MNILWMALREAKATIASRNAILILTALLMVDLMFIIAHVLHFGGFAIFRDPRFFLEMDRGYGEWYEYLKSALCILALAGCYRSSAQPVYWGLSVVYGLILADNALRLHERVGRWLSHRLAHAKQFFDDAPQALGELTVFAVMGLTTVAVLIGTFCRSAPVHQARGALFLFLIMALAGFAVGIDLLHAVVRDDASLDRLFGTIEDGGEMIVLSVTCAAALMLFLRTDANRTAI